MSPCTILLFSLFYSTLLLPPPSHLRRFSTFCTSLSLLFLFLFSFSLSCTLHRLCHALSHTLLVYLASCLPCSLRTSVAHDKHAILQNTLHAINAFEYRGRSSDRRGMSFKEQQEAKYASTSQPLCHCSFA